MSVKLADLIEYAGVYPSKGKDFSKQSKKLAELTKEYVDFNKYSLFGTEEELEKIVTFNDAITTVTDYIQILTSEEVPNNSIITQYKVEVLSGLAMTDPLTVSVTPVLFGKGDNSINLGYANFKSSTTAVLGQTTGDSFGMLCPNADYAKLTEDGIYLAFRPDFGDTMTGSINIKIKYITLS